MTEKESFLQYLLIEKRYSHHTVRSYSNDLDSFFHFLSDQGLSCEPTEIRPAEIRAWMSAMSSGGFASSTIHRKMSCLRVFFRWMRRLGKMNTDPMGKIVLPRKKKSLPYFVDLKAIDKLLDDIDFGEGFAGMRNRLIIEMLYVTGMRRAELTNLRIGDVDTHEGTVKVTGKRNKQRIVPLVSSFIPHLEVYIKERTIVNAPEDWLFVTDAGKKLYDKFVYNLVNSKLTAVTTIEKKSPHVLRHTFATHMLNRGADLNSIKELLGHANLSATQVYTHNTFEKLREVYRKAHPRG